MYQFNSRIRYSEIGWKGHLPVSGIVNYFQDCSIFHSEEIGRGLSYLNREHRAWIMNSWQVVVESYPSLGDEIVVSTWAYDFKGIYGSRNFLMTDLHNRPYAYANSIWVYMDTENKKPMRIPPEAALPYGKEEKYPMDYRERKIRVPDNLEPGDAFVVVPSHIDTNHHVNNSQYILMAEGLADKSFPIRQMRAEYRSSAYLGDTIHPKISYHDNLCTILLNDNQDSTYAVVEFERKES